MVYQVRGYGKPYPHGFTYNILLLERSVQAVNGLGTFFYGKNYFVHDFNIFVHDFTYFVPYLMRGSKGGG